MNKQHDSVILQSDTLNIVNKIYKGEILWKDLKMICGKGLIMKEILMQTVAFWIEKHNNTPSSKDLALLLRMSQGNVRRILSEYGIKLTGFK